MPRFTLTIDLGNDAANNNEDVGDLLIRTGTKIMAGWYPDGTVYDLNGNKVGHYGVTE